MRGKVTEHALNVLIRSPVLSLPVISAISLCHLGSTLRLGFARKNMGLHQLLRAAWEWQNPGSPWDMGHNLLARKGEANGVV